MAQLASELAVVDHCRREAHELVQLACSGEHLLLPGRRVDHELREDLASHRRAQLLEITDEVLIYPLHVPTVVVVIDVTQ